jgi:hypothetical protein
MDGAGASIPVPATDRPRCRCGHDRFHLMVSKEPLYTAWHKFWVMFMGVSATPIQVDFRCRVCKQVFDTSTDPEDLRSTL